SKAIELNPNVANAYLSRGNANQNKGDYKRAIADYSKAVELNSGNISIYSIRGNAYYHEKAYDKSLADMQKIEELGGKPDAGLMETLKKQCGNKKVNVYLLSK
ncbi:MAG: tetratricopeptide repeat protein, partial [Candidatus Omnitrophota bacterium]